MDWAGFTDLGALLTDERVERRLAAVLAADVAGYSRLMGLDEEGTLAQLKSCRKTLVDPAIAGQNADVPQDNRIEFRVGIHVGDIIIDDNDIFGDGVNIAARLEGIAEP